MIKQEIQIINKLGLHARASTKLVQIANQYQSEIRLQKGNKLANAKSIMSVMMLAATNGSTLVISVDGIDEVPALDGIAALIADKFGESE
jgi:phosphocarrier protein HPr